MNHRVGNAWSGRSFLHPRSCFLSKQITAINPPCAEFIVLVCYWTHSILHTVTNYVQLLCCILHPHFNAAPSKVASSYAISYAVDRMFHSPPVTLGQTVVTLTIVSRLCVCVWSSVFLASTTEWFLRPFNRCHFYDIYPTMCNAVISRSWLGRIEFHSAD